MGRIKIAFLYEFGGRSSPSRDDDGSPSPGPHASATLAPGVTPAMESPADDERTRGSPDDQRRFEAAKAAIDSGSDLRSASIDEHDYPGPEDEQVEREANRYCLKLPSVQEKNHGKAAVDSGSDLKHVYDFPSLKDEKVECDADKYYLKLSPVHEKNDSKLPLNKRKRQGRGGKRNPISVDKMHSSLPSSTALYDHNECLKSESFTFRRSSKRTKKQLQNSSSTYSQKVQDVIILDDEDTQPKEEVNFEMSDRQKEPKIYCPSRDNQEAADITRPDIKCLDPGECLSSPVINFYIEYIERTRLSDENFSDKFYIFNTYFYGKLEEVLYRRGDFAKLRRWWKGVNILNRAYIILPIHQLEHWSLVIICMPPHDSISEPLILHLDSLAGLHPSAEIMNTVGRYLEKEWRYVSIEETRWTCLLGNIHKKIVQVPQQKNAYDCGIFMLYYIQQFIKDAPQRTTVDKLNMFNRSWFKPNEASALRNTIRKLLLETFESAKLNDSAMPEADASEGNDNIVSDSHEASKELETGKINKGIEAASSKDAKKNISEDVVLQKASTSSIKCNDETICISRSLSEADVAILWKAPSRNNKRNQKTICHVLLEGTSCSAHIKDEQGTVKAYSGSSRGEKESELTVTSSQERSKGDEGMIGCMPIPDVVRDSSNTETTVKIIRAYKKYGPCRWKEGMEPGIRYWESQTERKRSEGAKLQRPGIQIRKIFRSDRNG